MSKLCGDHYYIKPIEICTFSALGTIQHDDNAGKEKEEKYYYNFNNIYNSEFINEYGNENRTDINYNFRDYNDGKFIYKQNENAKDLCFRIKPNDVNSPYALNCAIFTRNPFFTYDSKSKSCRFIPEYKLPSYLKYDDDKEKNSIVYVNDSDPEGKYSYASRINSSYCENKWYDWFIVPNYHFGNQYQKDAGIYSKEDVKKCYKPCPKGYMPYVDTNGSNICIEKINAENGLYSKKLDYSPFGLINLIGNINKNLISHLYISTKILKYNETQKDIDEKKSNFSFTLIPYNNDNTPINSSNIDELYKINNVFEIDICLDEIKDTLWNNIIYESTFDIDDYEYNHNVWTYKNPYFNENDDSLLTLRQLMNKKILTDENLIHTFFLAYHYHKFIETTVFDPSNNKDEKTRNETIKNEFNLNIELTKLINDRYKGDDNKKYDYKQRLANILYKAINICYDNKTDFSKNIINKTNIALDKYQNIASNKDYIYKDLFNDYYNVNILKNNIKNGIEITYYDKIDIILDIHPDIKNNVLFYTKETNEIKKLCKTNQILDDANVCQNCDEFCGKNDKCDTDDRCKKFCSKTCPKEKKKEISKCGKPIKGLESKEKDDYSNIKTPIEEDNITIIPNIQNAIKLAIKIFFIFIVCYIAYIFWQIYGEDIIMFINFVIFYVYYIYRYIVNIFNKNKYQTQYDIINYKYDNVDNKLEKIKDKINYYDKLNQ
jgi:hypothetical protein